MDNTPDRIVDLSHSLAPGGPVYPGDPPTRRALQTSIAEEGYALNEWRLGEHTGTHVGAPAHFLEGGDTLETYGAARLFLPLVIVRPVREEGASEDLTLEELKSEEHENGPIHPGALVVLQTGWSRHWSDPERYFGTANEPAAFPSFSVEAARFLLEQRKAAALGSDSPEIDPADEEGFPVGELCARHGALHVENLTNLEAVPARGAWAFLGVLPLVGATGSPARVIAFIPPGCP